MTLVAAPPATEHDAGQVGDLAERVLARPEFGRGENVLRQLQEWVVERITDTLSALGSAEGASALGWAVLAVVLVAAVVLIVRFGRGFRRDPGLVAAAAVASARPADEWRRRAAELSARGDHRGALRAHHHALLAELGTRSLVDEVPGRTAREYRTDIVAAIPAVAGPAEEATRLFERGVYGPSRPDGADVDRFAVLSDAIVAGAAR